MTMGRHVGWVLSPWETCWVGCFPMGDTLGELFDRGRHVGLFHHGKYVDIFTVGNHIEVFPRRKNVGVFPHQQWKQRRKFPFFPPTPEFTKQKNSPQTHQKKLCKKCLLIYPTAGSVILKTVNGNSAFLGKNGWDLGLLISILRLFWLEGFISLSFRPLRCKRIISALGSTWSRSGFQNTPFFLTDLRPDQAFALFLQVFEAVRPAAVDIHHSSVLVFLLRLQKLNLRRRLVPLEA